MVILAKLKAWLTPALAIAAAVFFGLFQRKRAQIEQERRAGIEAARDVERRATDTLTEGLTDEAKELEAARARRRNRTDVH